jgi:hypothetical protein
MGPLFFEFKASIDRTMESHIVRGPADGFQEVFNAATRPLRQINNCVLFVLLVGHGPNHQKEGARRW